MTVTTKKKPLTEVEFRKRFERESSSIYHHYYTIESGRMSIVIYTPAIISIKCVVRGEDYIECGTCGKVIYQGDKVDAGSTPAGGKVPSKEFCTDCIEKFDLNDFMHYFNFKSKLEMFEALVRTANRRGSQKYLYVERYKIPDFELSDFMDIFDIKNNIDMFERLKGEFYTW